MDTARPEKELANDEAFVTKASAEAQPNSSAVSLSITEIEAKKLFKISERVSGISINGFKGVEAIYRSQGIYESSFLSGVSNRLTIPDFIDGKRVSHVFVTKLPDDAIVYCSDLLFHKLSRRVRVTTACAWLEDASPFPAVECAAIKKFLAKYPSDVAVLLMEEGSIEATVRFLDAIKPTPELLTEMLKKAAGKPELTALLLSRKEALATKTKKEIEQEFALEEKPLPISKLKKLWTWSLYSTPEAKLAELTHYKGLEKKVVIPGSFGKNALGAISGNLLKGHDDVTEITFPAGDYALHSCSLHNCSALADSQGYIVVQAGERIILMDYIGHGDPYITNGEPDEENLIAMR